MPRAIITLVLVLGVTDVAGLIFFSAGLEVAPAWLVGLLASTGPIVGIIVGLTIFGERLRAHQTVGLILVAVAIVLVAVGELTAA